MVNYQTLTQPKNQKNIDKRSLCYFLHFQSPQVLIEHLHNGDIIKPGSIKIPHVTTAELKGAIFNGIPLPYRTCGAMSFRKPANIVHLTKSPVWDLKIWVSLPFTIVFTLNDLPFFPFSGVKTGSQPFSCQKGQWKGNCIQHDWSFKKFQSVESAGGDKSLCRRIPGSLDSTLLSIPFSNVGARFSPIPAIIVRATLSGEVDWRVSLCPDPMVILAALAP